MLIDAIDLRNRLEEIAAAEEQKGGKYIRPIVLFQAEPRGKETATTFEKLRDKLADAGIPAEQIAIRTADVNELKNIDLMVPDCPVRYIITVNALKEGWDCPFAYILASLANKTSQVDVEQILGRILRLPHTTQCSQPALNMSYVLTSSNDFDETVRSIIRGLNSAGFSDKDYRLSEPASPKPAAEPPIQLEIPLTGTAPETDEDSFDDLDSGEIREELEQRREQRKTPEVPTKADSMLSEAEKAGQAHEEAMAEAADDPFISSLSWEERDKVTTFYVNPQYQEDIDTLMIPQFFQVIPESLFSEGTFELLEKEQLAEGFTLKGKAYDIDFESADDEIAQVDVRQNEGGLPKVFKMSSADQRHFKEYFNSLPQERRVQQCKGMMFGQLNKLNMVDAAELRAYVDLIVGSMDKTQLAAMEKAPYGYAAKIKAKIDALLTQHYKDTFAHWLETERVVCRPSYKLPVCIHPTESTNMIGGALYQAEEEMNQLEQDLVMELTALPNIRWWHRNIARQGFRINGFLNHFPDIMLMTKSGKIVLVETKGEHLKNDDSRDKLALGQAWRNAAGNQYRYYMVFKDGVEPITGAVTMREFVRIITNL